MRVLVSIFICVWISLNSFGCKSNDAQKAFLIDNQSALGSDAVNNLTGLPIAGISLINDHDKLVTKTEVISVNTPVDDPQVAIDQTKKDLEGIATSFNFNQWYKGDGTSGVKDLKLTDFGSHIGNKNHVLQSPYFWIAFWNGYERHKNTTGKNKLDEADIKQIFQTYSNEDHKNKGFIEAFLAFAEEVFHSTFSAGVIVTDLKKGINATNPNLFFKRIILSGLDYSIINTLKKYNVLDDDSGNFMFTKGVFAENGTPKNGVKITEDITKVAEDAIRDLTILKESINKKMLPKLTDGSTADTNAMTRKSWYIVEFDRVITSLKKDLYVVNPYTVRMFTTTNKKIYMSVLTDEEFNKITNKTSTTVLFNNPIIGLNQILDGVESNILDSIASTDLSRGIIHDLIANSKLK